MYVLYMSTLLNYFIYLCVLRNYRFSLIMILSWVNLGEKSSKFGAALLWIMNASCLNDYWLKMWNYDVIILCFLLSFRSLSCQRITLHKNLFFSFICNSIVTIIQFTVVANNQALVATNPVSKRRCVLRFKESARKTGDVRREMWEVLM